MLDINTPFTITTATIAAAANPNDDNEYLTESNTRNNSGSLVLHTQHQSSH